ncbi:MAG TPA: tetratricopeptide repeat protein [Chthonomonadaceae bacterium]|nr:tetratricopeptide repeat protein [Chthonomonadaceae bacterium]
MGAASAAPAHVITSKAASLWKGRRFVWMLRLAFLLAAAGIGTWGVLHGPWYQERRLAHMSLQALQRERGNRLDDPRLLYYIGLRLNQQGRFAEADPLLRQAVGLDPDSPRLRDEWAKALLGSGLTTAAFGQLREFAGTHPDSAQAHLLLGKFYFTQRSMRRASEELERAVALDPGSGEAWSYLAGARDAMAELQAARQAAQKAVALRPENAADHLMLASLLARSNLPEEARKEYAAAVRLAPRWAAPHREYAVWLLRSEGRPQGNLLAESEARQAVALDANDARAQLALGRALVGNGQPQAAIAPLQRAAALAPYDPAAALELSQAYHQLGRAAESAQWQRTYLTRQHQATEQQMLYEAIRVHPNDLKLHARMARLLGLRGDVAGCIHNHAMALRCPIDAPAALIAAANDLTDGGHAAEALPLARRAVSVRVSNPAAHEALGNALLGLGQIRLAEKEYQTTTSWQPKRLPILQKRLERYLAYRAAHPSPAELAYREARRLEHAQIGPKRMTAQVEKLAQRAVELDPTNPDYLWYLLRIQVARRENEAAIRTANQLLTAPPLEVWKDARAHAMLAILLLETASRPEQFAEIDAHLQAAASDPVVAATRHYGLGLLALRRQQGAVAVRELRLAAQLDPHSDIIYYKLALAEQMAGNPAAAARAMAVYTRRQSAKREEIDALSAVGQHPNRPDLYLQAASLFDRHGQHGQAEAIRAEARRRFGALAAPSPAAHPRR